jgi:hypothetical protein
MTALAIDMMRFAVCAFGIAPNNVSKHYGVTVPCSSSASQVMGAVESNFAAFGNYSSGPFSLSFSQPSGMGVGSQIPIYQLRLDTLGSPKTWASAYSRCLHRV